MDEILKKLEGVLSADDLNVLKESVEIKASEIANSMVSDLEMNMVESLDKFLEHRIDEKISDERLDKIVLNETYEPLVKGIQKLFEDKFIGLDTEGKGMISMLEDQVLSLNETISNEIQKNMSLLESLEQEKRKNLILEHTARLTPAQREKIKKNIFETKTENLENVLPMLVESVTKTTPKQMFKKSRDEEEEEEDLNLINEHDITIDAVKKAPNLSKTVDEFEQLLNATEQFFQD